jgi:hypothetical protein
MEAPQFRDRITDFGDLMPSVRHAHQRARNLASTLLGREPVAFWSVTPDEALVVECGHTARAIASPLFGGRGVSRPRLFVKAAIARVRAKPWSDSRRARIGLAATISKTFS